MAVYKTIWDDVSKGDKEAYGQLYRYLFAKLYNYGAKFTSEIVFVEDAIQEALLLIWDSRKKIPDIRFPETYFFSVFRNLLFAKLKENAKKSDMLSETVDLDFNVEDIIIRKEGNLEMQNKLKKSLNKLTNRQREAVYLRFYEGFSYDKVAAVMGITTKATYKLIERALIRLREIMMVGLGMLIIRLIHDLVLLS